MLNYIKFWIAQGLVELAWVAFVGLVCLVIFCIPRSGKERKAKGE